MLSKSYIRKVIRKYLMSLPFKIEFAILFGSTVRGNRLRESDIDLVIVSEDFKNLDFVKRLSLLRKQWSHDRIELEVFALTRKEFNILKNKSIVISEANEYGERIYLKKRQKKLQPQTPLTQN